MRYIFLNAVVKWVGFTMGGHCTALEKLSHSVQKSFLKFKLRMNASAEALLGIVEIPLSRLVVTCLLSILHMLSIDIEVSMMLSHYRSV